jgi:putative sigma-54 modulation protein
MDISITGRNMDLDPGLKKYIYKRLGKVEKLYKRIYNCEVVLDVEKERHIAEVILSLKRNRIVAKESSSDIYASIDKAVEIIKKQLRRMNGKIATKRKRSVFNRFMKNRRGQEAYVEEEEIITDTVN